ncbi:MAG: hypothetical protein HKN94_02565 [Acidimicrobiales bacterium]|nr:hypothetical protein [Acidimicrobiales bacterium]RZV42072.1 MAG: hypothetical protein EX269_15405 [Acidimicrobiales bacterium]
MTTYTPQDRLRHKDDVDQWRADARWFAQEAATARDDAIEVRRLAADLGAEIDPLRTMLDSIGGLHTRTTWEGNAATASRRRLEGHEGRRVLAVRTLDGVIDDLEAQAQALDKVQQDNESWRDGRRADANWLASQIGYYNGVLL